jgi:hypothetical protein
VSQPFDPADLGAAPDYGDPNLRADLGLPSLPPPQVDPDEQLRQQLRQQVPPPEEEGLGQRILGGIKSGLAASIPALGYSLPFPGEERADNVIAAWRRARRADDARRDLSRLAWGDERSWGGRALDATAQAAGALGGDLPVFGLGGAALDALGAGLATGGGAVGRGVARVLGSLDAGSALTRATSTIRGTAALFSSTDAVREALRQGIDEDKLDPWAVLKAAGQGYATGATYGGATQIANPLLRAAGEVGAFGVAAPLYQGRLPTVEDLASAVAMTAGFGAMRAIRGAGPDGVLGPAAEGVLARARQVQDGTYSFEKLDTAGQRLVNDVSHAAGESFAPEVVQLVRDSMIQRVATGELKPGDFYGPDAAARIRSLFPVVNQGDQVAPEEAMNREAARLAMRLEQQSLVRRTLGERSSLGLARIWDWQRRIVGGMPQAPDQLPAEAGGLGTEIPPGTRGEPERSPTLEAAEAWRRQYLDTQAEAGAEARMTSAQRGALRALGGYVGPAGPSPEAPPEPPEIPAGEEGEGPLRVRQDENGPFLVRSKLERSTPELNPAEFRAASPDEFVAARGEQEKRAGYLSPTPPDQLGGHRLFLSPDGKVGYALSPEGDLQNVFNNDGKGGGAGAVVHAIEQGAQTLDAFDGFLPKYYGQFGFVETSRVPWDEQYKPPGWNTARDGRPDVVFMRYGGSDADRATLRARSFPDGALPHLVAGAAPAARPALDEGARGAAPPGAGAGAEAGATPVLGKPTLSADQSARGPWDQLDLLSPRNRDTAERASATGRYRGPAGDREWREDTDQALVRSDEEAQALFDRIVQNQDGYQSYAMGQGEEAPRRPFTRSGVKLLAGGLRNQLQRMRGLTVRGLTVRSPFEAAVVLQPLRNPAFETHWFIAVKDGKITGTYHVSSQMPDYVASAFHMTPAQQARMERLQRLQGTAAAESYWRETFRNEIQSVNDWIERQGADHVFSMHNHPTGWANPSDPDMSAFRVMTRMVPKLAYGIVLDHGNYGLMAYPELIETGMQPGSRAAYYREDEVGKLRIPTAYARETGKVRPVTPEVLRGIRARVFERSLGAQDQTKPSSYLYKLDPGITEKHDSLARAWVPHEVVGKSVGFLGMGHETESNLIRAAVMAGVDPNKAIGLVYVTRVGNRVRGVEMAPDSMALAKAQTRGRAGVPGRVAEESALGQWVRGQGRRTFGAGTVYAVYHGDNTSVVLALRDLVDRGAITGVSWSERAIDQNLAPGAQTQLYERHGSSFGFDPDKQGVTTRPWSVRQVDDSYRKASDEEIERSLRALGVPPAETGEQAGEHAVQRTLLDQYVAARNQGPDALGKFLDSPEFSTGALKLLEARANDWKFFRNWYDQGAPVIRQLFGDHYALFLSLVADTSRNTSLKANLSLATKAYTQFLEQANAGVPATEMKFEKLGLGTQAVQEFVAAHAEKSAKDILKHWASYAKTPSGGIGEHPKERNYVQNMAARAGDMPTIDQWMAQYFFGKDSVTASERRYASDAIQSAAERLGWTDRQVQAAIWGYQIYRMAGAGALGSLRAEVLAHAGEILSAQGRTGVKTPEQVARAAAWVNDQVDSLPAYDTLGRRGRPPTRLAAGRAPGEVVDAPVGTEGRRLRPSRLAAGEAAVSDRGPHDRRAEGDAFRALRSSADLTAAPGAAGLAEDRSRGAVDDALRELAAREAEGRAAYAPTPAPQTLRPGEQTAPVKAVPPPPAQRYTLAAGKLAPPGEPRFQYNTTAFTPGAAEFVKDVIERWPEFIESWRRGVRGKDMAAQEAQKLRVSAKFFRELSPGSILPDAYQVRHANLLEGSISGLEAARQKALQAAQSGDGPGQRAAEAEMEAFAQEAAKLTVTWLGVGSELGRALGRRATQMPQIEQLQKRAMSWVMDTEHLAPEAREALIKRIIAAGSDREKVLRVVRDAYVPTWWDKLVELRIMYLLGNPVTPLRNFIGNSFALGTYLSEVYAGIPIDALYGVAAKGDGQKRGALEGAAATVGLANGFTRGLLLASKALRDEDFAISHSRAGTEAQVRKSIGQEAARPLPFTRIRRLPGEQAVGTFVRLPGRILGATDLLFSTILRTAEAYRIAARQAINEGVVGPSRWQRTQQLANQALALDESRVAQLAGHPERVGNQIEAIAAQSIDRANEFTFREVLGPTFQKMNQLRFGEGTGAKAAKWLVPFLPTPVNITRFAARRAPGLAQLSAFLPDTMSGRELRSGDRSKVVDALARQAVGAAIFLPLLSLGLAGHLSTQDPEDRNARDQLQNAGGWQPNAVNVGGHWWSYMGFSPFSELLGLAAELAASITKGEDVGQFAQQALLASAAITIAQPYFTGIADLIDAVRQAGQEGENRRASFVGGLLQSMLIPRGMAFLARAMDPTMRAYPESIQEKLAQDFFVTRKSEPAFHDALGRTYDSPSSWLNAFVRNRNAEPKEPLDQWLWDISDAPGLDPLIRFPARTTTLGTRLSSDQYEQLKAERSAIVLPMLRRAAASGVRQAPIEAQQKLVDAVIKRADLSARLKLDPPIELQKLGLPDTPANRVRVIGIMRSEVLRSAFRNPNTTDDERRALVTRGQIPTRKVTPIPGFNPGG